MFRNQLTALVCVAMFSVSCGLSGDLARTELMTETLIAAAPAAAPAPEVETPKPAETETPVAEDDRVTALAEFLSLQPTGLTGEEVAEVAATIVAESDRHRLDLRLVLSLMYVESRYRTFAVSPVGAMGLMQVLPSTGEEVARRLGIEWYGPETLFDPVVNVRIGVAYMKKLTRRYGANDTALAAYNWGPGNIDKFLRRGSPVPTYYPGLINNVYAGSIIPARS